MEEGKNIFTVDYEPGRIKDFEKRILTEGRCKSFLPVSFVSGGEKERANYDCSGYHQAAFRGFESSMEMMLFLEKCAFALLGACRHLLNPRKIELNIETVFYSSPGKELRFAYVPKPVPHQRTTSAFAEFLEQLLSKTEDKEIRNYLTAVQSYIGDSNGSLFDIINYIGELKQEIHACR